MNSSTVTGHAKIKPTSRRSQIKINLARQNVLRAVFKTKLVVLDFANAAVRFGYTVAAKLIFGMRDLVIYTIAIVHSAVLIPLDFLLIIFHSAAAFVQKELLAKKREKWTSATGATNNSEHGTTKTTNYQKNNKDARFFEAQFVQISELDYIRTQFWAGEAMSLRNVIINMRTNGIFPSETENTVLSANIQSISPLQTSSSYASSVKRKYIYPVFFLFLLLTDIR